MADKAKILVVDDLAEKLLVYQTILEELGEELVMVRSGREALKEILHHDFAVILLDVNMPDMDGFETAAMIRARKKCAHTPIIFITAYVDEMHTLKGYSYGAVDYILAPVVQDVLRTKVRVFVDLFHKTREIQQQAEALREMERREHQRELSHTTERLDLALAAGRMGAWEWDLGAQLLSWSPTVAEIFGMPREGPGQFSGTVEELSSRLHPEDRERVLTVLQRAARPASDEDGEFRLEHRIVRTSGEVAWVEVRGRVIPPAEESPSARESPSESSLEMMPNRTPRITGVCMDITERKRAEEELQRHREHLEQLVLERTAELKTSHERLRLADRLASIGTLAAGLGHDMGNLLLPIRMRLDAMEKTIVAGMPARKQEGPKDDPGPTVPLLEDIKAIKTASEYLKRLSQGLRLFALDPEEAGADEMTALPVWWNDVEPFLRNTLPKGVALESCFPAELPAVCVPPHTFTQVIYNLVQNAGDALRERNTGKVTVSAALSANGRAMTVSVRDDGPGMPDDVRTRCMEPFFTTKTRGISTGLGLALVHGAVHKAGGTMQVESRQGGAASGTTFHLSLPAAMRIRVSGESIDPAPPAPVAVVLLGDPRLRAYVVSVLRSLDVEVRTELAGGFGIEVVANGHATSPRRLGAADAAATRNGEPEAMGLQILILQADAECTARIEEFLAGENCGARRVVLFGEGGAAMANHAENIVRLDRHPAPSQIRETLVEVIRRRSAPALAGDMAGRVAELLAARP